MNLASWIVLAVIVAAVLAALLSMRKSRNGCSCGPDDTCISSACSGCPLKDNCKKAR